MCPCHPSKTPTCHKQLHKVNKLVATNGENLLLYNIPKWFIYNLCVELTNVKWLDIFTFQRLCYVAMICYFYFHAVMLQNEMKGGYVLQGLIRLLWCCAFLFPGGFKLGCFFDTFSYLKKGFSCFYFDAREVCWLKSHFSSFLYERPLNIRKMGCHL